MPNLSVNGIAKLTRDTDVRKTSIGTWYSFGICAFRKNVKEGKQAHDFFDVDLYQREPIKDLEKKLVKGAVIYIDKGELKNDQYVLDGKERSKVRIYVSSFDLIGPGQEQSVPEPPRYGQPQSKAEVQPPSMKIMGSKEDFNPPDFPDDPQF